MSRKGSCTCKKDSLCHEEVYVLAKKMVYVNNMSVYLQERHSVVY